MNLYLVRNIAEDTTILDICTNEEKAIQLQNQYRQNFIDNGINDSPEDIIDVEVLTIDDNPEDVVWSYDKEQ